MDGSLEGFLDLTRYGPHLARTDGAEINLAQRDALGCGAAYKNLVGTLELVARDRHFPDFKTQVMRQGNQ